MRSPILLHVQAITTVKRHGLQCGSQLKTGISLKMPQYTVVDNSSARRTSVPELPDVPLPNRLCISSRLQHFVTSHIAFGSDSVNMVPRNEASGSIRRRSPARPTAITLVCYFFLALVSAAKTKHRLLCRSCLPSL